MRLLRLCCRPLLFACLWAAVVGCACSSAWGQRAWSHEAWSTENGLPQNSVHAILQTRDGYIWVATEGGLARFNGTQFTVFNRENTPAFTSDDLCCLAEDKAGVLWIKGADGLVRYEAGMFTRAESPNGFPVSVDAWLELPAHDRPAGRVQATLRDEHGRTWAGTDRGLVLVGEGKIAALGDASVLSLLEDREGDIWIGTDTSGLHVLRPQVFHAVPELLGKAVTAVTQAPDGAMWVGTRGDGLFRVKGPEIVHRTTQDGLFE